MQSYNKQTTIGTYTIEKSLLENLENYFRKEIFQILNWQNYNIQTSFGVIFYDSNGQEKYQTISDYKYQLFRNDIKGITLELDSKQSEKEIKVVLRFGNEEKNSDLSITLNDENARDKTASIESGLKSILNHNKNYNWIFYPVTLIEYILSFGGIIAGSLAISGDYSKTVSFLFGFWFWFAAFYFFVCRYFKGYCIFDTNRQKQLNGVFAWVIASLAGFLIFSTLLASVRKQIFGF